MRIAYFDCFAGASGDMILGALLDAGLSIEVLKMELDKLNLTHFEVNARKVVKRGIGGSQALISIDDGHHGKHHRHLEHIHGIIRESGLTDLVKRRSMDIFTRLAEAEAQVHQTDIDKIHFHEVGAMDAIVDVVGAVAGLGALGIERIYCSPLHVGTGTVKCAHGMLPVPAPATAVLVQGRPVYSTGVQGELLTPTGAAILTTLASDFGPMPAVTIDKIGYGAGASDPEIPNLLRIIIGEAADEIGDYHMERICVVECGIDDMNPQIYDYVIERVLDMGANDICLTPLHMKKNRPATMVTVLCPLEKLGSIADFLLKETTSIGLRWRIDNRIKAERSIKELDSKFGPVRFKFAVSRGRVINVTPEYDDCRRIALREGIPLKEVMEQARLAVADIHGLFSTIPERM